MRNLAIYIDNELVDTFTDTEVYITYQVNDIAELANRQADFTNRIRLPLTPKNRRIFGYAVSTSSESDRPYTQLPCRIVQDGIEIIANGTAEIEAAEDAFEVQVFSGIFNLFNAIGDARISELFTVPRAVTATPGQVVTVTGFINGSSDKIVITDPIPAFPFGDPASVTLAGTNTDDGTYEVTDLTVAADRVDVDVSGSASLDGQGSFANQFSFTVSFNIQWQYDTVLDFDHVQDVPTVAASRLNTWEDGYTYPVIQYGQTAETGVTFDVRYQFPAFFLRKLFDEILMRQDYSYSGALVSDSLFDKLVIPFTNTRLRNSPGEIYRYRRSSEITYTPPISGFAGIEFDEAVKDTSSGSGATGFIPDEDGKFVLKASVTIGNYAQVPTVNYPIEFRGFFYKETTGGTFIELYQTPTRFSIPDSSDFLVEYESDEVEILAGERAFVIFENDPDNTGLSETIRIGSSFTASVVSSDSGLKGEFVWAENVPNIKQKDIIKTVLQMYGGIIDFDDRKRTVNMVQFSEIVAKKNAAPNWSDKVDISKPVRIEFSIGDYAQQNYLRYKEDPETTEELGDGTINIADTTLNFEADFIELEFAASDSTTCLGKTCADVTKFDEDRKLSVNTEPRLLYIENEDLSAGVQYTDGVNTQTEGVTVPVGKFIDPDNAKNIAFGDSLISDHYAELSDTLQKAKKVSLYLNLTPLDIANLDFFTPIYINIKREEIEIEGYFYLNIVSEFRAYESTPAELIKL